MTLVLPGHHRDMVTLFHTGTDLMLVTLVLTLASSVPGDSGSTWASPVTGESCCHLRLTWTLRLWSHLDLTWIWWLWFPYGALLDLGPVVSIWPHLEHNDSDPYLGLSRTCCLW